MPAVITFDDSLWPLVTVRWTGVMNDLQFEEFLVRSASFLERGESYISITDVRHAGVPSIEHCRALSRWLAAHEARLRERVLCNAILVTSAPLRLSMSLAFHLKPQPMPHRAVSTMDAALEYALGKLREAGRGAEAERLQGQLTAPSARVG